MNISFKDNHFSEGNLREEERGGVLFSVLYGNQHTSQRDH